MIDLLSTKTRQPAECIVSIGGREMAHLHPFLVEARIEQSRGAAATGMLRFDSARDEEGAFGVLDEPALRPWQAVVVKAAFGDTVEELLRGYVREVHASYPDDPGASTVEVELQDESLALDREHVRKVWGGDVPTTDALVLAEIAGRHGLRLDPRNGDGLEDLTLGQNTTDIRFLRQRALANGYELILDRGEIYFGPPRVRAEAQETILVYAGLDTHCIRFDVKADSHLPDTVAYDAAPAVGSKPVSGDVEPDLEALGPEPAAGAGRGLLPFVWRLDRPGSIDERELAARARGLANEMAFKVRAEGELDGSLYGHVLRAGRPVGVDGLGRTMSGVYYVDAVTHVFSVDGYRQSFTLLRNAYGDNLETRTDVLAGAR